MKKILKLSFVMLILSTVIKAQTLTSDATLKNQGLQNEASTVQWLQAEQPDPSLITMSLNSFDKEFLKVLSLHNTKYNTFSSINNTIINEEIVPKLYTEELDPNKLYRFSFYDLATKKWGSWLRKPKKLSNGRIESGLFFPGWDDPLLSVWCWNFGYPDDQKVVVPVRPDNKVVYEYNPGTTKIINNGPDSVIITNTKVLIENNYAKVIRNTQTDEVDMTETVVRKKKAVVEDDDDVDARRCGCPDDYRKKKEKKPFFNTTGGRILSHGLAIGLGYGARMFVENNWVKSPGVPNAPIITQGPFVTTPGVGTIVYTQGEF